MAEKLTAAETIALRTIGGKIARALQGNDAVSLSLKGYAQSKDGVMFQLTPKGRRALEEA